MPRRVLKVSGFTLIELLVVIGVQFTGGKIPQPDAHETNRALRRVASYAAFLTADCPTFQSSWRSTLSSLESAEYCWRNWAISTR